MNVIKQDVYIGENDILDKLMMLDETIMNSDTYNNLYHDIIQVSEYNIINK